MKRRRWCVLLAPAIAALLPGMAVADRIPQPTNVDLPPGYFITSVATGLNFPTAVTFGNGAL